MDNYEKNYLNSHPENLCLICGKCCGVAAAEIPYDELLNIAKKGDTFVNEFLEIFIPYESVDEVRKINAETVDNILREMYNKNLSSDLTFYHCKYLQGDNVCGKFEDSITLYKDFTVSPWGVIPQGCILAGSLFLKFEKEKQRVRKAKEELIDLAFLKTKIKNKNVLEKIKNVEKKLNKTIELYKRYGSADW